MGVRSVFCHKAWQPTHSSMFLQLSRIRVHFRCCLMLTTQTWQHRLTSGNPTASLRCFTHSGKTHVTFLVLDLQFATVTRTKTCLAHIFISWLIQCSHELHCHCFHCRVVSRGLIRSSWTDASARTYVPHPKCSARWNRRCKFHAFCLIRSNATRIRSQRCVHTTSCSHHKATPSETSSRIHLAVSNALAQLLRCRSDGSLQPLIILPHQQGPSVSIRIETIHARSSDL